MCPFLEEGSTDDYCGITGRKLLQAKSTGFCSSGAYTSCGNYSSDNDHNDDD